MKTDHDPPDDKYLKTRVSPALHAGLQGCAGAACQRLNTYVREALLNHVQALSAQAALERVEAAVRAATTKLAPPPTPARDRDTQRVLELERGLANI